MISSVLILIFSVLLFAYWFRYTCRLILKTGRPSSDWVPVRVVNTLDDVGSLDPLHQSLERDYAIIRYVLDHAADAGVPPVEQYLLEFDYRMMHLWYWLTRRSSDRMARKALIEMSSIVTYLGGKAGHRADSYFHA